MASGRVLVVHESEGTRAQFAEILGGEGLRVETVASSIRCISRFVDEPAELVVLGLSRMVEAELELIRTLKLEPEPPRILVCFPTPKRDIAVSALKAGADAYLLEPFYAAELVALVRAQRRPPPDEVPADMLAHFAGEVAHAINNPLQVILLLLAKERVTKKELMDQIPQNVARIHRAVELLKQYGTMRLPAPVPGNPLAVAERVARDHGVRLDVEGAVFGALCDERALAAALDSLFDVLGPESATLLEEPGGVALRVHGDGAELLDHVLVVTPEREILPGLLFARTLLERQGGSLTAEGATTVARLPRA